MHFIRLCLVLGGLLVAAPPAWAGLLVPLSIEELTGRAELILQAKVVSQACERAPEGHIRTRVQLEVTEVIKGELKTNRCEITHSGGVIGDSGETSDIQASYEVGEETLVFLRRNNTGDAVTVGVVQGKFQIWTDQTTGERYAHNLFHGVSEAEATRGGQAERRLPVRELVTRAKGATK